MFIYGKYSITLEGQIILLDIFAPSLGITIT